MKAKRHRDRLRGFEGALADGTDFGGSGSRVTELRGASAIFDHRICRAGQTLVQMDVRVVCLRLADGRAVRFPARTRAPFEALRAAELEHIATATGS